MEGHERVNNMRLFLQGKRIVKKVNYTPVKSSRLYCLVFNNFLIKSKPSHSTKASKSALNDAASLLYQAAIKLKRISHRARKEKYTNSKSGVK